MRQGLRWFRCAAGLAVLLTPACRSKSLPGAPSELTTGIVVFEHANFTGASAHIEADVENLEDFRGPCVHTTSTGTGTTTELNWGDCISSIRVAPGWRATIYRDDSFKGQSVETTADLPNLQLVAGSCDKDGLNDCISSIRVRRQ
jgi:peptidase inhibitor family I36